MQSTGRYPRAFGSKSKPRLLALPTPLNGLCTHPHPRKRGVIMFVLHTVAGPRLVFPHPETIPSFPPFCLHLTARP